MGTEAMTPRPVQARGVRVILLDYDAGTKVPGSGDTTWAWKQVLAMLSPDLRKRITSRLAIPRSLGRYAPSIARLAVRSTLSAGERPIILGGDHSLSYWTSWGVRETVGQVDVLHLDAHHDSYPVKYLSNYSFAHHAARDFGHEWHGVGWRHEPEFSRPNTLSYDVLGDCWLSFDFDYFDTSVFPEVRFPVDGPGGVITDVVQTLERLKGKLLGADLLEWTPSRENPRGMETAATVLSIVMEKIARDSS
jgi:arginase family enzyme